VYPPAHAGGTKNHARDLDLLDHLSDPIAGKFCRQTPTITEQILAGQDACETYASPRAFRLTKRVRSAGLAYGLADFARAQQKEDQCQES
jgi:hypothetical protein